MDKRYQVFISSTYADLKEERQSVIQTVIETNCIPAGMELFPAADEQQLAFIKRVIGDCDYYLLIIGGRYGSMDASGISYTEQEYDYAVGKGLKVIALLHEKPEEIPLGKSEGDPAVREKLEKFRKKVAAGRLVKFWTSADELPGLVAINLLHAINAYPATGWVRANKVASEEILAETNELRKANEKLKAALADLKPVPAFSDLAGLDEKVAATGTYWNESYNRRDDWSATITWRQIFAYISPYMLQIPADVTVKQVLLSGLEGDIQKHYHDREATNDDLDDQFFQTIGVQFEALGLIKREHSQMTGGGTAMFWSLTSAGKRLMIELRTVRTKSSGSAET